MSFRHIHLLSKFCCVMPLKLCPSSGASADKKALFFSAACVLLAFTESIYGSYWYASIIATDLTLTHAMKVNVMLSVFAKIVTVGQIGAVGVKILRRHESLIDLTNIHFHVSRVLFSRRRAFSCEILTTCVLITLTTLTTFFAYLQHYEVAGNDVKWLLLQAAVSVIKFVNCCVFSGINLQFWGFCQMFRTSFAEINVQLEGIKQSFADKKVKKYSDVLVALDRLRFCRSRLCDAVDELNELFGICVLLALLSYNIYVHLVVYLVLTEVIDFIYDVTNQMNFGTALVWLVIDIFFISTYFQGCVRTALEVEKTSKILSNMSHSLPSGSLRETVYLFLTEVNAKPIIFSAYGVFHIDLPLLFVSAASCAINMAILLQSSD